MQFMVSVVTAVWLLFAVCHRGPPRKASPAGLPRPRPAHAFCRFGQIIQPHAVLCCFQEAGGGAANAAGEGQEDEKKNTKALKRIVTDEICPRLSSALSVLSCTGWRDPVRATL